MRQLTLTGKSNIFQSAPLATEDYIYAIDVDPVQMVASVRVGMRVVVQNEILSQAALSLPCRGSQVTVTFHDKAYRAVTFFFGKYLPCSPRGEVCSEK